VWRGPDAGAWTSSLDRAAYVAAVGEVRAAIRAGTVYQANLCRVLAAPLPVDARGAEPDARALGARLAAGNPAPYAGVVHVPGGGAVPPVWVVSASPELYLRVADGWVTSAPIKGTAPTADGLTAKDRAENVMITDLVRNDLQRVCDPGTVEVTTLLGVEEHPGLVHLVSTVRGRLRDDVRDGEGLWADLLAATYPRRWTSSAGSSPCPAGRTAGRSAGSRSVRTGASARRSWRWASGRSCGGTACCGSARARGSRGGATPRRSGRRRS
jgi:para-aminobenzoate synthetase component 1